MASGVEDEVRQLVATVVATEKLGARGISLAEADETLRNRHILLRNRRGHRDRPQLHDRRLLIGRTDGDRPITLVIEVTLDPTTWLLITGWDSTTPYSPREQMSTAAEDPHPGDFDDELADVPAEDIQIVGASDDRELVVQFTLRGDEAQRLERMARERGEDPGEVVASLIRSASQAA